MHAVFRKVVSSRPRQHEAELFFSPREMRCRLCIAPELGCSSQFVTVFRIQESLMCRYWVADIGGTNCRLADFFRSQEDCRLEGERWIPTSSLSGDADLVAAFEQTFADSRGKIDALAVALAGPVHAGYGALTNGALQLDAGELSSRLGKKALLLNDFAAQAYASVSPLARSARVLREGSQAPDPEGVRGVLGAGTVLH